MANGGARSGVLNIVERPSVDLLQRWLQKHADLLIEERKVEKEEARLLLSKCSPKQLERNGLAILGLGVLTVAAGLGGKTLVELERPAAYHNSPTFPPHSLRPGDVVQIEEHGSANEAPARKSAKQTGLEPVPGVVFRVSDAKITVAASSSKQKAEGSVELTDLPTRVRVVKVANEATFDRMEWALSRLAKQLSISIKTSRYSRNESSSDEEDEAGSKASSDVVAPTSLSPLVSALVGYQEPKWKRWPEEEGTLKLYNEALNASQIDAVRFALGADHFALIHGPPGTGKTTAVAEMVLQLAITKQKRVLVCGASNLAADNLMERIISKGSDSLKRAHIGISRVGHPARVLPSVVRSTLDYQAQHSSEGALLRDVQGELDAALTSLRPTKEAAGNKSTSSRGQASAKSQRPRGNERKERREEIKALRREYRKRSRLLMRTVLQRASIVVSTCHGAGGRQLDGMEFDAVVIDEACQATEAACWVPLVRAKADGVVILAGDHLQLPPTVKGFRHSQYKSHMGEAGKSGKIAEDGSGSDDDEQYAPDEGKSMARIAVLRPPRSLETTMFSRLLGMYGQGCKALLDTQYRMNAEIMAFPNDSLYQGKIRADESCKSIRLHDLPDYKRSGDGEGEEEEGDCAPIVFYDTAGCEMYESQQLVQDGEGDKPVRMSQLDSRANVHEVELVIQHVGMLLKRGLEPSRISVLSPYNLQVSALADRLRGPGKERADLASLSDIVVGSIDSMQGMENDVVILSLVRSNEQRSVGFLAERRRLNVAMTRPKRQLCVIGDSETIGGAGDRYLRAWMDFLEHNALIEPVIV